MTEANENLERIHDPQSRNEAVVMKPCPFCGSENIEQGEALMEQNGRRYSQAGCTDCGALGPVKRCQEGINFGPDRYIESTRAWNLRTS